MNYLKPILGPIQERMKNASTQEEKLLAQQELMAAQRENGVSMFGWSWVFATLDPNAILLSSLLCSSAHQRGSR